MKKTIKKLLMIALITLLAVSEPMTCMAATGINVKTHSQSQIRSYVKKHKFNVNGGVLYKSKPSISGSYKAGSLKSSTLKDGLNALNTVRYIAGIPANVTLNSSYNELAQAASMCNAANGSLSHYPAKPAGMSASLYSKAQKGASSSNIAWASWQTSLSYNVIHMWMDDGDAYNIDRVGHRRWILNPSMKQTGFGAANGYSALYAFDNTWGDTPYYGVAWPAQTMPVEYFGNDYPWSISMGYYVNPSKVKVTLTRKSDGKKWVFSKSKKNGYFNVENSGYGRTGCIIFRPNNITYKAGDKFDVVITGLNQKVTYTVKFFKL